MKTINLFLIVIFAISTQVEAQGISKNALGVRLGHDNRFETFGADISYQLFLSDGTRLELDGGIRSDDGFDAFKVIGLFQWVMPLDRSFHWYVGAGGGLANVSFDAAGVDNTTVSLLSAVAGIEIDLKIPLLISLDLRPELGFSSDDFIDGFDFDLGLGIRYQF